MSRFYWKSSICILVSILLFLTPVAAIYPPNDASWTVHRGIWENQGINPYSDSPSTNHELWNNTTLSCFTCDPVAAIITVPLGVPGEDEKNLLYTGRQGRIDAWDTWTGNLLYSWVDMTLGKVIQIIVDDPIIVVKTDTEIRGYTTDLTMEYWKYTNVTYLFGAHVNETAGHITPGLDRFQLVRHQVITGVVNGSDSNYSGDSMYDGHRAVRADYDTTKLTCVWHRNLVEEVWNTPTVYINDTADGNVGGNNTTMGSGHYIPGYGAEFTIPPEGTPTFDVEDRNVIFHTRNDWLYCLRADDGSYSLIQDGTGTNITYTNPRYIGSGLEVEDTWSSPVVMYHVKTYGNNSWGGGDGTWQGGSPIGCDVVFFLTSNGYANGICLYDGAGLYTGLYTWQEMGFNISSYILQSFAADESNNYYDDNPSFNESYLYVGDASGFFYRIRISDGGSIFMGNAGVNNWRYGIDSPIFNKGRIYTLMNNVGGLLKIDCYVSNLNPVWTRDLTGLAPIMANLTGRWNPEPCLAFDTIFITAFEGNDPNMWAQRDNEPPIVDCGEVLVYPVVGQQYDFNNASAWDPDGTVANITWDFNWGYRYTLIANFTFWVYQSTTGYLNVTDDDGATASDSFTIIPQLPAIPNVNISWIGRVDILNNTQEFNGTNTTGTNLTWWNWSVEAPNGTFWYDNGTNLSINYTFTVWADTYNITLNVTDEWDQGGEQSVLVYIYLPDPPIANITWDGWAVANITETFNGSANSHGTNLTWWNWTVEYPNGTFWYDNGTNGSIDFIFDQANETYNVTLNLTDEWGQWNETMIPVPVYPTEQPQFNWTSMPTQGYVGDVLSYSFTSNNTTLVTWDWGDGSNSTTTDGNASHTWGRWGTFTVTITVWNDQNVSNTTTFDVKISLLDLGPLMTWLWYFLILIIVLLIIRFVVAHLQAQGEEFIDV